MQVKHPKTLDSDRRVLICSGTEAQEFLNSILACELPKPEQNCFGVLLNNKGRVIFDFFVWCCDNNHYLLDCCASEAQALAETLLELCLGHSVKISLSSILSIAHSKQKHSSVEQWSLPDPRTPAMGWRTVMQDSTPDPDPDYLDRRLMCRLPEGARDLLRDEALPLEYGLDHLGAVALNKGCYLGQEVTTRMARKQSSKYTVCFGVAEILPDAFSALFTTTNKKVGKWISIYGDSGFVRILKSALNEETLIQQSHGRKCVIRLQELVRHEH